MGEGEKLLPCPLCGGPAIYRDFPDVRHVTHYVECAEGPCDLTLCAGNNKDEAIAAWNTRPTPSAGDVEAVVAGKRLKIKPGAPEIALLCRAIFRSKFADDEDEALVNAKYNEWPDDAAASIRAAHFVLRALGGNGSLVAALSRPDAQDGWNSDMNAAPKEPSVGIRGPMLVGMDADGRVEQMSWSGDHPKGSAWLITDDGTLAEWEPVYWAHLPEEFQDKDGVSYRARKMLS